MRAYRRQIKASNIAEPLESLLRLSRGSAVQPGYYRSLICRRALGVALAGRGIQPLVPGTRIAAVALRKRRIPVPPYLDIVLIKMPTGPAGFLFFHTCTSLHYYTSFYTICNPLIFVDVIYILYTINLHYEVTIMAEALLVNRTRFTSSLKNELMKEFNHLADKTRVPKSRLLDEAIEDLLKKYEKRTVE